MGHAQPAPATSRPAPQLAGFQVSIIGRFWVSTVHRGLRQALQREATLSPRGQDAAGFMLGPSDSHRCGCCTDGLGLGRDRSADGYDNLDPSGCLTLVGTEGSCSIRAPWIRRAKLRARDSSHLTPDGRYGNEALSDSVTPPIKARTGHH